MLRVAARGAPLWFQDADVAISRFFGRTFFGEKPTDWVRTMEGFSVPMSDTGYLSNTDKMVDFAVFTGTAMFAATRAASISRDLGEVLSQSTRLLPDTIPPRGFQSADQFKSAMTQLNSILNENGIDDASFRMRGSSTTGLSENPEKPGKWFDAGSDIDLSIESKQLSTKLYEAGQTTSEKVPGLFKPEKIEKADSGLFEQLSNWNKQWSKTLGHDIMPGVSDPQKVKPSVTDVLFTPIRSGS